MNFESGFKYFHSIECIWKCHGVQFVSPSMCCKERYFVNHYNCIVGYLPSRYNITGARLDVAHPIWRTRNVARKLCAISPILPVFCRYYLCDAIMLIKLSMVWPWVTRITTQEVAIVLVTFARHARINSQRVQDARTYQAGCANVIIDARTHTYCSLDLFSLTWVNCNPRLVSR